MYTRGRHLKVPPPDPSLLFKNATAFSKIALSAYLCRGFVSFTATLIAGIYANAVGQTGISVTAASAGLVVTPIAPAYYSVLFAITIVCFMAFFARSFCLMNRD